MHRFLYWSFQPLNVSLVGLVGPELPPSPCGHCTLFVGHTQRPKKNNDFFSSLCSLPSGKVLPPSPLDSSPLNHVTEITLSRPSTNGHSLILRSLSDTHATRRTTHFQNSSCPRAISAHSSPSSLPAPCSLVLMGIASHPSLSWLCIPAGVIYTSKLIVPP